MENIEKILIINLKKGIKTCQNRINKGLEGKKLTYALRYIKGAKTRLRKLKKLGTSKIINKISNISGISKIINKISNISGISKIINKTMKTITKKINEIKERREENKKEKEFARRWEELEESDRWSEWYE